MGAADFAQYVKIPDPRKAFERAREDAFDEYEADRWDDDEYEGYDGYSGTIYEKSSYTIRTQPMTLKEAYAYSDEDLENNDKWGPAFAIPIVEKAPKQVVEYIEAISETLALNVFSRKHGVDDYSTLRVELEQGVEKRLSVPAPTGNPKFFAVGNMHKAGEKPSTTKRDAKIFFKKFFSLRDIKQLVSKLRINLGDWWYLYEVESFGVEWETTPNMYKVTGPSGGSDVIGYLFYGYASY